MIKTLVKDEMQSIIQEIIQSLYDLLINMNNSSKYSTSVIKKRKSYACILRTKYLLLNIMIKPCEWLILFLTQNIFTN